MKVKLLKKVRKRFAITHHPKGIVAFGEIYDYNLFILTDAYNPYSDEKVQCGLKPNSERQYQKKEYIFENEAQCINYLKDCIIERLKSEGWGNNKMRLVNRASKKVWYVNN